MTNGANSTDCTSGGGTTQVNCQWNGTAYTAVGGGGGGGSGFPITIGGTAFAANSTHTAITGLTVNGVVLNGAGSSTLFLNQAGSYTALVNCVVGNYQPNRESCVDDGQRYDHVHI